MEILAIVLFFIGGFFMGIGIGIFTTKYLIK